MNQSAPSAEDHDLAAGLTALARLSTARMSLVDVLTNVATYAAQAIPGADGAGLTLIQSDRADTVVASEPFVREIDDVQYGLGEGPCISAAEKGEVMRSGSIGGDPGGRGSERGWGGSACTACCPCHS